VAEGPRDSAGAKLGVQTEAVLAAVERRPRTDTRVALAQDPFAQMVVHSDLGWVRWPLRLQDALERAVP